MSTETPEREELAAKLDVVCDVLRATQAERDDLAKRLKQAEHMQRMAHRAALQAEKDAAIADAKVANRDAEIARLNAREARHQLDVFDAAHLRVALAELVRLKDGPRDAAYERDKPIAWNRARKLLAVQPGTDSTEEETRES